MSPDTAFNHFGPLVLFRMTSIGFLRQGGSLLLALGAGLKPGFNICCAVVVPVSFFNGGSGRTNLPGVERLANLYTAVTAFVEHCAGFKKVTSSFAEWSRGASLSGE